MSFIYTGDFLYNPTYLITVRENEFLFKYIGADSLDNANDVLKWLISNVEGDQIEEVTDEMLGKLVSGDHPGVASVFCKCI